MFAKERNMVSDAGKNPSCMYGNMPPRVVDVGQNTQKRTLRTHTHTPRHIRNRTKLGKRRMWEDDDNGTKTKHTLEATDIVAPMLFAFQQGVAIKDNDRSMKD